MVYRAFFSALVVSCFSYTCAAAASLSSQAPTDTSELDPPFASASSGGEQQRDCVILLHGLARSASSMQKLADYLRDNGYLTINVDYPSRDKTIEQLAPAAISPAIDKCGKVNNIHFVSHSMGGILIRQYLSHYSLVNLGRVVMLGPPNKGSEVVDKLAHFPGFHFLNGDAGLQLGTGKLQLPKQLPVVNFDLGVIAGTRSINLILSTIIPGPDDGKVSVASTKVDGMNEHLILPVTHTFMMKNRVVMAQVVHYLRFGRFRDEPSER